MNENKGLQIPYWLLKLLPMWDHICPKCRKEVKRNSHKCIHCGENYGVPLRVPPRVLKDTKALEEYVHKNIFPKVSAVYREYLTQFFTILFSDGQVGSLMETAGNFSAWTGTSVTPGATLEVIAAAKHHGNNGAHALRPAWLNNAYAYKTFGSSYKTLYTRMYIYLISITMTAGFGVDIIVYVTSGGGRNTVLQIFNTAGVHNWRLQDNLTSVSQLGSVVTTGVWHCIEIKGHYAVDGEARFYLDGVEDIAIIGSNDPAGNCLTVRCGLCCFAGGAGNQNECYFDCVVMADAYIGPEVLVPPKGTIAIHAKLAGVI